MTSATGKYLGKTCFYFTSDGMFCGFDFILSLSSQYLCVCIFPTAPRAADMWPHPWLMSSTPAKAWILQLSLGAYVCCLLRGKESTFKPQSIGGHVSLHSQSFACHHGTCGTFPSLMLLLLHKAELKQFKRFQKKGWGSQMYKQTGKCVLLHIFLKKSD